MRLVVLEVDVQLVHPLQVEEDASLGAVDLEGVVVACGPARAAWPRRSPVAPFSKRARKAAASSTVTCPSCRRCLSPFAVAASSGRSLIKVSMAPTTSAIGPTRKWARSMMWAPMSPRAPEPASSFWKRQTSGKLRVEDPVLQVDGPPVPDLAEPSLLDELLRELDGGHPPVVEVDHVHGASPSGAFRASPVPPPGSWPAASRRGRACRLRARPSPPRGGCSPA